MNVDPNGRATCLKNHAHWQYDTAVIETNQHFSLTFIDTNLLSIFLYAFGNVCRILDDECCVATFTRTLKRLSQHFVQFDGVSRRNKIGQTMKNEKSG